MLTKLAIYFCLLLSLVTPPQCQVEAFVVNPTSWKATTHKPETMDLIAPTRSARSQLFLADEEGSFDGGITRGIPLMMLVLLVNIWLFSIPTEFRRGNCKCVKEFYKDCCCVLFNPFISFLS
jgi:hypothetical protein